MKTIVIVINRILLVLVSLFCCHGLTDGMVLKGRKIEETSNFAVVSVGSKLIPIDYLISIFNPSIKMLDIPNELLDHKFKVDESKVVPMIFYETSPQIPDPNAGKRIIRRANIADNNTTNSTAEDSKESIDQVILLSGDSDVTVKKHSTGMIDTMLNGVSNCTSSIFTIKKRNMDLIPTISAYALIGAFVGILLFVAVRANKLWNSRREAYQYYTSRQLLDVLHNEARMHAHC